VASVTDPYGRILDPLDGPHKHYFAIIIIIIIIIIGYTANLLGFSAFSVP
jgi:hypothetical protein